MKRITTFILIISLIAFAGSLFAQAEDDLDAALDSLAQPDKKPDTPVEEAPQPIDELDSALEEPVQSEDELYKQIAQNYKQKKYATCVQNSKKFIKAYPSSSKVENALLLMGFSHKKLNEKEKAINVLKTYLKKYPNGKYTPKAQKELNELQAQPEDDMPTTPGKAKVSPTKILKEPQTSINLLWNFELGGGDLLNTYISLKIPPLKAFTFGVGGSFTFSKDEYEGVELNEYYYTFAGLVSMRLTDFGSVWLNIRERIGKQFISIDTYLESGQLYSTDLLIGYKNFTAILAVPLFIGSEGTDVTVTMGIGYQMLLF